MAHARLLFAPLAACALVVAAWADDAPRLSGRARLVFDATNSTRKAEQLRELRHDGRLTKAAQEFAEYMARTGKFSHTADDRHPWDRTDAADYPRAFVSENLAWRQDSPPLSDAELTRKFITQWRDSPGHHKNQYDPHVYDLGVGVAASDDGKVYAVQLFGIPKDKSIEFRILNQTGAVARYKLGEREFTLEPRVTRIHTQARPEELVVQQPKGMSAEPLRLTPSAGATLTLRSGDGGAVRID